ncbi:efflux RND transporter periplasmic adaptor subunit [Candidatus Allofournierella merdipullorum]|uniref:efflux RND transporter periplasmic adaptor subunit n=1 Tax=Candidatus Allofournierella merdipullorum TaxID=2838595 RepID=UPI003AB630EC
MEQTANVLNTKRRKMLAAAGAGLALCVLTGLWLVRPRAAEEPPLRREYPVSRQDVTVGVDAAGSIQSRQWGQFAPVAVKLKEYRVSLGAQVAEGDVLAEYDLEDLQRLARESEARLAEKQSALDKLDLQKKDDEARLQKELDDLVGQGAPEEQLRPVREALAQNELDTADAQRQREEALTADYEGQAAEKQQQADTAKAAREQALAQLKQTEQQLQEKRDARDALRKKEDSQIETMKQQAAVERQALDSQIEAARLARDAAKTERDDLLALCADPTLRADRAGTVTALGGTPGLAADPASPLAKIGDAGQRSLVLQVDVGSIQPGQEVSFYVDAYPEATFTGRVESVSRLQNDGGKFEVRASFSEGGQPLYDGMGANATLIIKQKKDVVAVSNKAIQFEDGESFVWLADENGQLRRQTVATGFSNGRITEILSSLQEGDVALVEEQYEDR